MRKERIPATRTQVLCFMCALATVAKDDLKAQIYLRELLAEVIPDRASP